MPRSPSWSAAAPASARTCSASAACCGRARASARSCTSSCCAGRPSSRSSSGGGRDLLPERLVLLEPGGAGAAGPLRPHWLDAADHPWLRELVEQVAPLAGRPLRALAEGGARADLARPRAPARERKEALARHVLLHPRRPAPARLAVLPARIRAEVFAHAATGAP